MLCSRWLYEKCLEMLRYEEILVLDLIQYELFDGNLYLNLEMFL